MADTPLIPKPADTQKPFDPAHRAEFVAEAFGEAALFIAALRVVTRVAPHPIARAVGIGLLGLTEAGPKSEPHRPLVPGPTGGPLNYLPSPIGYVDPRAFGLEKNFYLPSGSSAVIPRQLDVIGFGLREQRAEDARQRQLRIEQHDRAVTDIVTSAPTSELQVIVESDLPFGQRARYAAGRSVSHDALAQAAAQELARRAANDPNQLTPLIADLSTSLAVQALHREVFIEEAQGISAELDREQQRLLNALIPAPGPDAGAILSTWPSPVNALQQEAARRARDPLDKLITERADP